MISEWRETDSTSLGVVTQQYRPEYKAVAVPLCLCDIQVGYTLYPLVQMCSVIPRGHITPEGFSLIKLQKKWFHLKNKKSSKAARGMWESSYAHEREGLYENWLLHLQVMYNAHKAGTQPCILGPVSGKNDVIVQLKMNIHVCSVCCIYKWNVLHSTVYTLQHWVTIFSSHMMLFPLCYSMYKKEPCWESDIYSINN